VEFSPAVLSVISDADSDCAPEVITGESLVPKTVTVTGWVVPSVKVTRKVTFRVSLIPTKSTALSTMAKVKVVEPVGGVELAASRVAF
jgi:hypothetical protein